MSRSPEFYGRSRSALPPPAGGQSGAEVQKPPGVPGYEGQWRPFETEISGLKLELADRLSGQGKGRFELADCEVKSNWVRIPGEREKRSRFLHASHAVMNGESLHVAGRLLGHRRASTTNRYVHLDGATPGEAAERVAGAIAAAIRRRPGRRG